MRMPFGIFIAGLLSSQPVFAAPENSTTLTQGDEAAIEEIIAPTLIQLRGGHAREALKVFFGTNRLMAGKSIELQALSSQINATMDIYGPMGRCELVERKTRGSFVQLRLYVCQHETMATRWVFSMVKTTSGWSGVNVYFDDKAFKAIGE